MDFGGSVEEGRDELSERSNKVSQGSRKERIRSDEEREREGYAMIRLNIKMRLL